MMPLPSAPTVLLVDDHENILTQTGSYLTERGYQVVSASSPFGVSALILRHRPAVAVLDVMMPGLDGERLAEVLSYQPAIDQPAIIFYSAMEEEELYLLSKRRPGSSYVHKSDGLARLLAAIEQRVGPA
jgi:DNA-binding response OmpR family regulator